MSSVQVRLPLPGPLVKRLRHRPFTAVTWVRFPYGSPKKKTSIRMSSFFTRTGIEETGPTAGRVKKCPGDTFLGRGRFHSFMSAAWKAVGIKESKGHQKIQPHFGVSVFFCPYGNRKAVKKHAGGMFLGRGRFHPIEDAARRTVGANDSLRVTAILFTNWIVQTTHRCKACQNIVIYICYQLSKEVSPWNKH